MAERRGLRAAAALAALAALLGPACARAPRVRDTPGAATVIASWYGPEFHGRPTSSGEVFDMNDMTAAHNTLPLGCYVLVTNPADGRSVVVRVNDRGPFVRGRTIDLSYAAARVLGLVGPGTARVRLDVLRGFKAPSDPGSGAVWVQVGAFTVQENAYAVKRRLDPSYPDVVVSRVETAAGVTYRVRVRAEPGQADRLARRLAGEGFAVVIVRE